MSHQVTHGVDDALPLGRRANATTWVVAGSGASMVGAYAFQILGTRTLGDTAFAPIGVLWTILYLIMSVMMPGIEAYVTKSFVRGRDSRSTQAAVDPWIYGTAVVLTAGCMVWGDVLFSGQRGFAGVVAPLVVAYGYFVVVRGTFIGTDRYREAGLVNGGESVLRLLVIGGAIVAFGATPALFAWSLPVGAVLVVAWYWLAERPRWYGSRFGGHDAHGMDAAERSGAFLAVTGIVNAIAQILVAGGILILAPLGATPAEVSVAFVALTVARIPVAMGANGVFGRLLPPLIRQWEARRLPQLRRNTALVAAATIVVAVIGASGAWMIGPAVVGVLFGTAFTPDPTAIGAAVAGSLVLTGAMLLNQVLIAMSAENRLLVPWFLSIATAAAVIALAPLDPFGRVLAALVTGAVVALAGLVVVIYRHDRIANGADLIR